MEIEPINFAAEILSGNISGEVLGFLVTAALLDSINPCVFGVLIFLLAFMTRVFKTRNKMLLGGLLYTSVVYATYFGIGYGLKEIVSLSDVISTGFYWFAAIVALVAGLLEIKDYFWYGKGFSLQMIPGASKRLKMFTTKLEVLNRTHPRWSLLFIGFLGVFVVLVELPCTGAPYLAVIALIEAKSSVYGVPLLLLYNFIFILPLFAIIGVAYFGKGSGMEVWRQKHRGSMRLAVGLFLIAIGIYMIDYLIQFEILGSIFGLFGG